MPKHQQQQPEQKRKKPSSHTKMIALVEKYKELKATGKLQKYLERKRKKLIKRDEKLLIKGS